MGWWFTKVKFNEKKMSNQDAAPVPEIVATPAAPEIVVTPAPAAPEVVVTPAPAPAVPEVVVTPAPAPAVPEVVVTPAAPAPMPVQIVPATVIPFRDRWSGAEEGFVDKRQDEANALANLEAAQAAVIDASAAHSIAVTGELASRAVYDQTKLATNQAANDVRAVIDTFIATRTQ